MTEFQFEEHLPWSREVVFTAFRDRMKEYGPLAPNVVGVKILEKKKLSPTRVRIRAQWQAKADIPFVVRSILKPHMLAWKDEAIWDEENFRTDWKVESLFFKEFVTCSGSWDFKKVDPEKTKVHLKGNLHIYIPHFPPFPDKLVRSAGEVIEKFVLRYLEPNLRQGIIALKTLLEKEEKRRSNYSHLMKKRLS